MRVELTCGGRLLVLLIVLVPGLVFAGEPRPADGVAASSTAHGPGGDPGCRWLLDVSVTNLFDGNINHEEVPVQSYGLVPAAAVRFESSEDPAFTWGYELASNNFTGTDQWDRISHGLYGALSRRMGRQVKLDVVSSATWKGSSEDRELSNEFGVAARTSVRVFDRTRVSVGGGYRYKQYPDDPGTSGPSPFVSAKLEQRFAGDRRVTVGYKHQERLSRAPRDRYRRDALTAGVAMPVGIPGDRFELEVEVRPQVYNRLVKVGSERVWRRDQRFTFDASYRRPLTLHTDAVWFATFQSRESNDADKRYSAPAFGMTLAYHWR